MCTLYNRIAELRKARGIKNDTEMCRLSGLSRGALTDLKNGRIKSLSSESLRKLSDLFDVSTDFLLGLTDQKKVPPDQELYPEVIAIQRGAKNMSPQDRQRMLKMIMAAYDEAFKDEI